MRRLTEIMAHHCHQWRVFGLAALLLGTVAIGRAARAADYVWIEAENTTALNVKANDKLKVQTTGWGNKQFLSGESWLQISAEAGDVDKQVPDDGVILQYQCATPKAANYEIWDRIGFEFARSPFDWRLDGGDWKRVAPDDLTTDLMEIGTWNEVAWLKLGNKELTAGQHKLEIRLPKMKDEKGNTARILYASDAVLLYPGTFQPNGSHKPDENYRDAKDEQAARQVFAVHNMKVGGRQAVSLAGTWEACRNDEQMPGEVAAPIKDFPTEPHWKAIEVPSDKNKSRPDLVFAHRLWYRTRLSVPNEQVGHSCFVMFPMNSLNTTVYVNGVYCGFSKNPLARCDIDVTKGIKAGVNELWVGIRDAWYGRTANPQNPLKLRRTFNLPIGFFGQGFQDLAYPIWNNSQSGILEAPEFVITDGPVYASDVFVKPSVARKQLAADVTLTNNSEQNAIGEIQWQVDDKSGAAEKSFAAKQFTVAAGAHQTLNLAEGWTNAKLWWPDDPNMYRLRVIVTMGGQPVDVSETSFGFREWTSRGTDFLLNGVPWRMWADLSPLGAKDKTEFLAAYNKTHQRTFRLMMPGQGGGTWRYLDMPLPTVLDFFDHNGVVVRRNGMIDGEAIGYAFSEGDADLKKLYGTDMKVQLMQNWKDQMVAEVKAERNHPSIQIWSIENEFAFINLINLLGNGPLMDEYEQKGIQPVADAVMAADPTRFVMTDGGGATKAQTLPVHGNHYMFSPGDTRYPDLAYESNPEGGGRGRWVWDMKRPRFIGEDYFATGISPADYAMWGGEEAFQGKAATKPAVSRIYRMLNEGYRWAGQSAWQFWMGQGDTVGDPYVSAAPRAVFVRQYDWSFGAGQTVKRTFGIFNDTEHPDPLVFTRTLLVNNKKVWTKTTTHNVAPGMNEKFDETLPALPSVTTRQEAELVLTLSAGGHEIFRDVKPLSILPNALAALAGAGATSNPTPTHPAAPPVPKKTAPRKTAALPTVATRVNMEMRPHASNARITAQSLIVYDPQGDVAAFLKGHGVPCAVVNSLENLPATGKVLLVGPDALTLAESTATRLAAYASAHRTIIVLDQKNPLKFQAIPAEMEPVGGGAKNDFGQPIPAADGHVAFIEDASHPAFRGLQQKDFYGWGADGLVYRNAYVKPGRGGKSLVQAGMRLTNTVLTEVPVGTGLLLLSQLEIGEKIKTDATAQQLLANLITYGMSYKLEYRQVAAAIDDPQLQKAIDAVGLQYSKVGDPLTAMSAPGVKLAIVSATPANLKQLVANLPAAQTFMRGGGYIMLHGLTPDGLADYNKLVGFEHMLRPFHRERVSFPVPKNPLTSGLNLGDIVMLSGQRINGWTADEYVAGDIFSYVVDYEDVAPFGKSDSFLYANATNNFFQSDGWQLINNFEAPKTGTSDLKITLNKPQPIREVTWVGNTLYNAVTKINLMFDGKDKLSFPTAPTAEPQTFEINPPRTAQEITLQMADWQHIPGKQTDKGNDLIGLDNIYYRAQRPTDFYQQVKPMLNVGGLMQYPRGAGGIVLCNLLFKDNETTPVNTTKKRAILAAILRNLQAPFAGGKTVIAGANLNYTPIDIGKQANQYRNERGWFGDSKFTFAALPTGKQTFAGVTYNIYDFPTSPVPTAIMLGGAGVPNNLAQEVKGIPVNLKADALFFLQAARMDAPMNEQDIRDKKRYQMARYVAHYADGQTANIPVYADIDIDDYKQQTPTALPGAQIAWTRPYEGTEYTAVAYSKQWNNPRPDVAITSLDFQYGDQKRGVPVLLAVTAATAAR